MTQHSLDSKWHIFALCLFAAIGPLVMMTTPVLAHELGFGWNLAPSQVGTFSFYEQLYMGIAAIPAIWWSKRFSPRSCMKFFITLFILGNLLSFFAHSLTTLILARSFAAFAAGSILIITMSSASMTSKPARTFALWLLGQTILGALAIAILPKLFASYGLNAFFALLVVLMVIAAPLYRQFTAEIPEASISENKTTVARKPIIWKIVGILAVLSFFISISSIWTFLTSIGLNSNIAENTINGYLSFATLFGILGSLFAAFLGNKINRLFVISFGFIVFFISLSLMFGTIESQIFMLAILAFKFAWMFTFPFILGSISSIDENGAIMKFVSLMIALGMAIGPVVSGQIIEKTANFSTLLSTASALFLASLVLMLLLNIRNKEQPTKPVTIAIK